MKLDRRDFLLQAGSSLGAVILGGCNGAGDAMEESTAAPAPLTEPVVPPAPTSPAVPPVDPVPVPEPLPTPEPEPVPPTPTTSPEMRSLQAYLRANASPTFSLPPVSQAIPEVSWAGPLAGGSSVATTMPSGITIAASSPLIRGPVRPLFKATLSGNPTLAGHPCLASLRPYTCKRQPRAVATPTVLHFRTDAPVIEIGGVVSNGLASFTVQTLIVDGELVPPTVLACMLAGGAWNSGSLRIDFGSRALRTIWIETALQVAFVKIDQQDSLLPVDDAAAPQMTVVGDSYQRSTSAWFGNDGALAFEIGARLGIRNVALDAISGTGYWNSGSDLGNLNDRLPAHALDDSSIYLVVAGINDYVDIENPPHQVWPSTVAYEGAVFGYLRDLRAARPNALIAVTAPFCPVPPMSDASFVTAGAGTNTSGLGDFLYKADVQKRALQQIAGPWVYIDVLMGGGWLNSSGATGDITNLQWFTGGTPAPGTTADYKPGNPNGGGGGGFGGIAAVPVLSGGKYTQAPDIRSTGGSGRGLLLTSSINSVGALTEIKILSAGTGYSDGSGLPTVTIDSRFAVTPGAAGTPILMQGINRDGKYPLPAFAPGGAANLNNIYSFMLPDMMHPSPPGIEYLSRRLAQNLYEAVLAL